MIHWWRWLIRLFLIIIVGLLERAIGFPVIMLLLTGLYTGRFEKSRRWALLVATGIMVSTLFMVPLSVSWLVISGGYLWSQYGEKALPSKLMRLVFVSLVGAFLIVIIGLGSLSGWQVIYATLSMGVCIAWLKRHRLYLK